MAKLKFCTHCGVPLSDGSFCTSCGNAHRPADMKGAARTVDTLAMSSAEVGDGGSARHRDDGSSGSGATASATALKTAISSDPNQPPPPAAPMPSAVVGVPLSAPAPNAAAPSTGPQRASRPPWLAIGLSVAVVLALATAAAVILLVTGGKPAAQTQNLQSQATRLTNTVLATRQLYVPTQQSTYSALLPAGWQQVAQSTSILARAVTVQSPVDNGATITVGQVQNPPSTLAAEGKRLLTAASSLPAYRQDASTALTLAGGGSAWELAYQANGSSSAYYVVRSCKNMYAVTATVPPIRVSLLRQRISIVAATLQGNC